MQDVKTEIDQTFVKNGDMGSDKCMYVERLQEWHGKDVLLKYYWHSYRMNFAEIMQRNMWKFEGSYAPLQCFNTPH